jgi:hypothetical protein
MYPHHQKKYVAHQTQQYKISALINQLVRLAGQQMADHVTTFARATFVSRASVKVARELLESLVTLTMTRIVPMALVVTRFSSPPVRSSVVQATIPSEEVVTTIVRDSRQVRLA